MAASKWRYLNEDGRGLHIKGSISGPRQPPSPSLATLPDKQPAQENVALLYDPDRAEQLFVNRPRRHGPGPSSAPAGVIVKPSRC